MSAVSSAPASTKSNPNNPPHLPPPSPSPVSVLHVHFRAILSPAFLRPVGGTLVPPCLPPFPSRPVSLPCPFLSPSQRGRVGVGLPPLRGASLASRGVSPAFFVYCRGIECRVVISIVYCSGILCRLFRPAVSCVRHLCCRISPPFSVLRCPVSGISVAGSLPLFRPAVSCVRHLCCRIPPPFPSPACPPSPLSPAFLRSVGGTLVPPPPLRKKSPFMSFFFLHISKKSTTFALNLLSTHRD